MTNQKFLFETIPSSIIILIPALLITGPFLSDLGVSIVAILFIINSFKNNLSEYFKNIFFIFFLIFCIFLIISSLLSNNILISLKNSFFYFRFGVFSLCFWYLIDKNSKILIYLFYSIAICFFSLIVDGYFQYFFGKNLFGVEIYREFRVSSFFGSELILGSYLCRFFPILFALFIYLDQQLKFKSKLLLSFVTIIFILTEGLILLSGERLALFFMNLSAIFIIFMIKDYRIYRLWTYVVSLVLIFLLLFFLPITKQRIIDQTINDFTGKNSGDEKIYIFSKTHDGLYESGVKIFLDNKIFGVGPRQFRNECKKYRVSEFSCDTHPHNTYIELLSEAGIFSFLIVIGLFILIIYLCIKQFLYKFSKNKKIYFSDIQLCLLSAIIISLWPFSPSGSFFNNWMSIVYYFPVGIFLWQNSLNIKNVNK